jgi:NAD(P)H-hydrate repair Nnr-like enzyme with NAD(P)H-hydrate epimerase domain
MNIRNSCTSKKPPGRERPSQENKRKVIKIGRGENGGDAENVKVRKT